MQGFEHPWEGGSEGDKIDGGQDRAELQPLLDMSLIREEPEPSAQPSDYTVDYDLRLTRQDAVGPDVAEELTERPQDVIRPTSDQEPPVEEVVIEQVFVGDVVDPAQEAATGQVEQVTDQPNGVPGGEVVMDTDTSAAVGAAAVSEQVVPSSEAPVHGDKDTGIEESVLNQYIDPQIDDDIPPALLEKINSAIDDIIKNASPDRSADSEPGGDIQDALDFIQRAQDSDYDISGEEDEDLRDMDEPGAWFPDMSQLDSSDRGDSEVKADGSGDWQAYMPRLDGAEDGAPEADQDKPIVGDTSIAELAYLEDEVAGQLRDEAKAAELTDTVELPRQGASEDVVEQVEEVVGSPDGAEDATAAASVQEVLGETGRLDADGDTPAPGPDEVIAEKVLPTEQVEDLGKLEGGDTEAADPVSEGKKVDNGEELPREEGTEQAKVKEGRLDVEDLGEQEMPQDLGDKKSADDKTARFGTPGERRQEEYITDSDQAPDYDDETREQQEPEEKRAGDHQGYKAMKEGELSDHSKGVERVVEAFRALATPVATATRFSGGKVEKDEMVRVGFLKLKYRVPVHRDGKTTRVEVPAFFGKNVAKFLAKLSAAL